MLKTKQRRPDVEPLIVHSPSHHPPDGLFEPEKRGNEARRLRAGKGPEMGSRPDRHGRPEHSR